MMRAALILALAAIFVGDAAACHGRRGERGGPLRRLLHRRHSEESCSNEAYAYPSYCGSGVNVQAPGVRVQVAPVQPVVPPPSEPVPPPPKAPQ